jgi:hypothetical protein
MSKLTIPLTPVASSQIHSIGHDPATNTLAIRFADKSGDPAALYHYSNFPAEEFEKLSSAESIGSHFYKQIKPHADDFPYTRINEEDDE